MCRKLETEQEKVLPVYASSLAQEEEQQAKAAQLEEPTEPLAKVAHNMEGGSEASWVWRGDSCSEELSGGRKGGGGGITGGPDFGRQRFRRRQENKEFLTTPCYVYTLIIANIY